MVAGQRASGGPRELQNLESIVMRRLQAVEEQLAEKASKQSVAQALHRKINKQDVDDQMAKKADLQDLNKIFRALDDKVDIRRLDELSAKFDVFGGKRGNSDLETDRDSKSAMKGNT